MLTQIGNPVIIAITIRTVLDIPPEFLCYWLRLNLKLNESESYIRFLFFYDYLLKTFLENVSKLSPFNSHITYGIIK